jgi:hypothetical protein
VGLTTQMPITILAQIQKYNINSKIKATKKNMFTEKNEKNEMLPQQTDIIPPSYILFCTRQFSNHISLNDKT